MGYRPLVKEINYCAPETLLDKLGEKSGLIFLDSATHGQLTDLHSNYSYLMYEPFDSYVCTMDKANILTSLKEKINSYKLDKVDDLPPMQTGVAGYFSYDICNNLDNVSLQDNGKDYPRIAINFYNVVIAFDHRQKKAWIIANGYSEADAGYSEVIAEKRLKQVENDLQLNFPVKSNHTYSNECKIVVKANYSQEEYCQMVEKAIEYIRAGDIFEVNLSQQFRAELPNDITALELYKKLRNINPAPFAAYLNFDGFSIASASPERFIKLTDNCVETRPIKGTRARGSNPLEDNRLADELVNSEKDRAENIMIVDLMRNDISRVCEDNSVIVTQLCGLESFKSVHHLVSVVQGKLKVGQHALDLLEATLPGGSITGAPKIRAMQIIAELERNDRGPYCGSIGFISFNGEMDTSIVIRTMVIKNQVVTYQAGGAIVLDSVPLEEYKETLAKSHALTKTLYSFFSDNTIKREACNEECISH